MRRLALTTLAAVSFVACDSGTDPEPEPDVRPNVLLVTSIPDQSGQNGSSFLQTISLDQPSVTNANAFEQTFFAYAHQRGSEVIVTQHLYGDQMIRYVRGADGRLTETGRLSLPAGGFGSNVVWASDTKAFVSLLLTGQIVVFNPQTMAQTGVIDLTTLGIARNPANPADRNPEPGVMAVRAGKLYVGLQQFTSPFASADGLDVAVFDAATNAFERVVSDPRSASAGRYGNNQTMFVDAAGDLYVYGIASFGFVPGQRAGFLRIRAGQTAFDPTYFLDTAALAPAVPGNAIGTLNGMIDGGDGFVYGTAEVPAGRSNPPNYIRDRNWQPVRFNLAARTVEVLPLPAGNGFSTGVGRVGGRVLFGLSTETANGSYAYDLATGQGSPTPLVTTAGAPQIILGFD